MAWKLAVAFVALSALAFTLHLSVDSPFSELSAIQLLENRLAHESLHLLAFPESETPLSIRLSKSDLNRYQIYAKNTSADSYLLIGKDGTASLDRTDLGTVRERVHVHLNGGRMSLFIDGKRVPVDLDGFTAFYLTAQLATPKDAVQKYTEIDMADSFMRTDLFADSNWSSDAGQWALNKHGAGLIEERHWLTESSIARAVNPFSVRGSGNGRVALFSVGPGVDLDLPVHRLASGDGGAFRLAVSGEFRTAFENAAGRHDLEDEADPGRGGGGEEDAPFPRLGVGDRRNRHGGCRIVSGN